MSYSVSVPAGPKHDLVDRLAAAWQQATSAAQPSLPAEYEDHHAAVAAAVPAIAMAVGRPEDHVEVTVSGHVNAMHAPSNGWADETLSVRVSVVKPS